jgi:hypothetical protein
MVTSSQPGYFKCGRIGLGIAGKPASEMMLALPGMAYNYQYPDVFSGYYGF